MKTAIIFILSLFSFVCIGQEVIDGEQVFQSDLAKKYSIYVPSNYDQGTESTLMVGLHPFNTSRWNSTSWRDTLIDFAEMNNLLLICPDGGIDGRIDDPIDTAFTTAIIDSMELWYNIDPNQKYLMGFSWGGKTTYSYGLRRTDSFAGFMPIGAAISGAEEFTGLEENMDGTNFYLVHGSQDIPQTRYFPALDALTENSACVESNYLEGVGHTIDFENRNQILTDAFQYLVENSCANSTATLDVPDEIEIQIVSEGNGEDFQVKSELSSLKLINVVDGSGRRLSYNYQDGNLKIQKFNGIAFIVFEAQTKRITKKLMVIK